MRVTFLCLSYHLKSKSSLWFVDKLKGYYDVAAFAVNTDPSICHDIVISKPDLVICWQCDILAPWFIAHGIPAVVVPMADAVKNLPKSYFGFVGQLGAVSFTEIVHDKFLLGGILPFRLKYFPKPRFSLSDVNSKREIDLFFGYRGSRWSKVTNIYEHLESEGLAVHVHNMQDAFFDKNNIEFDSVYFKDKNDLFDIMRDSKFFLVPRYSEGIGMFALDAMSLGCVPIAIDGPGNSDYVVNGITGFLLDKKDLKLENKINVRGINLNDYRENIFNVFSEGHDVFLERFDQVCSYLDSRVNLFNESKDVFVDRNLFVKDISPKLLLNHSLIAMVVSKIYRSPNKIYKLV